MIPEAPRREECEIHEKTGFRRHELGVTGHRISLGQVKDSSYTPSLLVTFCALRSKIRVPRCAPGELLVKNRDCQALKAIESTQKSH